MAENRTHAVTVPPASTVASVEADIARTRERLSFTLTALNGDVRALLDPETPVILPPPGNRDAADTVAAGLRTVGQIRALARPGQAGPLRLVTIVTGVTVFLFRSGVARRVWNRKRR
jgi:hypothetical protein